MGQPGVRVGPFEVSQCGSGVEVRWRQVGESRRAGLLVGLFGMGAMVFLTIAVSAGLRNQWSSEVIGPYVPTTVERSIIVGVCLVMACGLGYLAALPLAVNRVALSATDLRTVRWDLERPWRRTIRLALDEVVDLGVRRFVHVGSEGELVETWRVVASVRSASEVVLASLMEESHARLLHDQLVRAAPAASEGPG